MITQYIPIVLILFLLLTVGLIILPLLQKGKTITKYSLKTIYHRFHTIKNLTPHDLLDTQDIDEAPGIDQDIWATVDIPIDETTPPSIILDQKTQDKIHQLSQQAITEKEKGNLDTAEKLLVEARSLVGNHESSIRIEQQLGDIYFEQGQYIKANSLLKKVISTDDTNHKATRQVWYIYMTQGDLNTAKIFFEKAILLKQDYPKYYISLVDILYQQQQRQEAIYAMEKAQKLRPKNIEYMLSLAQLNEQLNNIPKATHRYTKIVELEPTHPIAKQKLS